MAATAGGWTSDPPDASARGPAAGCTVELASMWRQGLCRSARVECPSSFGKAARGGFVTMRMAARASGAVSCALAILSLWPTISAMAAIPVGTFARPQLQPRSAVVIAYRSGIEDRPLLRREVLTRLVPRLDGGRRDGTISGYQLLFNSFVDSRTWDLLAILSFRNFDGIDRWRE